MLHTGNIYNVIKQCYLNLNKTNVQNWKLSEAFIALVGQLYNSLSTFTYSVRESINIYWAVCNLTSGQSQVSVTNFWHQPLAPCLSILISALWASCLCAQWHGLSGWPCLPLWSICCQPSWLICQSALSPVPGFMAFDLQFTLMNWLEFTSGVKSLEPVI